MESSIPIRFIYCQCRTCKKAVSVGGGIGGHVPLATACAIESGHLRVTLLSGAGEGEEGWWGRRRRRRRSASGQGRATTLHPSARVVCSLLLEDL